MTSPITLRPLEPADADALFSLVDSSRDSLSQWLPWVDTTRSPADSLTFIQHTQAERDAGRVYTWLIVADGQPAGVCDLHGVSLLNLHGSVGYWLADAYVGRGYLPQALAQVLHTAFAELGLNRVDIVSAAANLRSCAVAERSGFTQEGVLRGYLRIRERFWDARIYSQLAADWRSAQGQA